MRKTKKKLALTSNELPEELLKDIKNKLKTYENGLDNLDEKTLYKISEINKIINAINNESCELQINGKRLNEQNKNKLKVRFSNRYSILPDTESESVEELYDEMENKIKDEKL